MYKKYLFNFAVSFSGGGLKRLQEYAKWFHAAGGAGFIVQPNCAKLEKEYPNNRYYIVSQPRHQRLLNDCAYLRDVLSASGRPTLYYSYGIPVYRPTGVINWFHLSNVLPLQREALPLDLGDRIAMTFLGWKITRNIRHADVVSAESNYSLSLLPDETRAKQALSVNGSDDELAYVLSATVAPKEEIATVLGTYRYKALIDSWHIFEMLRRLNPNLKLNIIGNEKLVPDFLRNRKNVQLLGLLPRAKVITMLHQSRYYISTTFIENSYNAASEGVFCADESYISDIGPHRELLDKSIYQRINVPNVSRSIIHVCRKDATTTNLLTWHRVISDMIARYEALVSQLR